MGMKWIAIMGIGFVLAAAILEAVKQYGANQCKVVAVEKGMNADDIVKLCGKH